MPAMTMPLRVHEKQQLKLLAPGSLIEFELAKMQARRIRLRLPANEIEQDGRRLVLEPPPQKLQIGAPVPPWKLVDHHQNTLAIGELQGKVVAIQFLYTRCPVAEICPRLAATFARLQRRFAPFMDRDLVLLSVTLDPRHDTPAVLARYAQLWGAKSGWRFLTGTEAEIREVAGQFGILYWPEEGVITHNSTIGIVNRQGRLAALIEGLSFNAQQLGDLIAWELGRD